MAEESNDWGLDSPVVQDDNWGLDSPVVTPEPAIVPPPLGRRPANFKLGGADQQGELSDQTSVGRIMDAFGVGFADRYGIDPTGLNPETTKEWNDWLGLFPDGPNGNPLTEYVKAFNNVVIRGSIAGVDAALRAVPAAIGGVVAAGLQTGVETGIINPAPEDTYQSIAKVGGGGVYAGAVEAGDQFLNHLGAQVPTVGVPIAPRIPKSAAAGELLPYVGMGEDIFFGTKSPPADIVARGVGVKQVMLGDEWATHNLLGPTIAEVKVKPPVAEPSIVVKGDEGRGFYIDADTPQGTLVIRENDAGVSFRSKEEAQAYADEFFSDLVEEPKGPPVVPQTSTMDTAVKTEKVGEATTLDDVKALADKQYLSKQDQQLMSTQDPLVNAGKASIADVEQVSNNSAYSFKELMANKITNKYSAEQLKAVDAEVSAGLDAVDEAAGKLLDDATVTDADILHYLDVRSEAFDTMAKYLGDAKDAKLASETKASVAKGKADIDRSKKAAAEATAKGTAEDSSTVKKMGTTEKDVIAEHGGKEKILKEARAVKAANKRKDKAKIIKDWNKPTLSNMALEYLYSIGMLSNPITWGVNALGSSMSMIGDLTTDVIGATVGTAIRLGKPGVKGDGLYLGAAGAKAFGLVDGLPNAFRAAWNSIKTETATYGRQKFEGHHAIPGKLGHAIRMPTDIIMATDELFKAEFHHSALREQAYLEALKAGHKPGSWEFVRKMQEVINDPSELTLERAAAHADVNTFTAPLTSKAGKSFEHFLGTVPVAKFIFIPFFRTPVNIAKWQLDHSPVSLLSKKTWDDLAGKNGGKARDKRIGKLIFGAGLTTWAWGKAQNGELNGSGPADPNANRIWVEAGNVPNSITVGNRQYPLSNLDPFGKILTTVANIQYIRNAIGTDEAADIGVLIMNAASEAMINRTWMSTPADFIDAVNAKDDKGIQMFLAQMASRPIPAIEQQLVRSEDPYLKDTQTFLDSMKSKVLGLNDSLPYKIDVFGNKIERSTLLGAPKRKDYVAQAMYDSGYFPALASRKINGIELTPEQYEDYAIKTGKTLYDLMKLTVDSAGETWNTLPVGARRDMLLKAGEMAHKLANDYMISTYPNLLTDALINKAGDYGIELNMEQ